jgi:hypothetical protein
MVLDAIARGQVQRNDWNTTMRLGNADDRGDRKAASGQATGWEDPASKPAARRSKPQKGPTPNKRDSVGEVGKPHFGGGVIQGEQFESGQARHELPLQVCQEKPS